MKVREWEGEVVFLHEVGKGAADRSYGIQVARLAGLPEPVLRRARQVLTSLEQRSSGTRPLVLDDLPLFAHAPPKEPAAPDPVHHKLDAIRPDEITPREALELLYELKTIRDTARRR
jgi:DNA mismatch repair protein MutS